MYDTSHILEHHGVKGQKWGVRRNLKSAAFYNSKAERHEKLAARPTNKPTAKGHLKKAAQYRKQANIQTTKANSKMAKYQSRSREKSWEESYNSRSHMSDQELRSAVNRLQLENQFRQQVKTAAQSDHTLAKQIVQQNTSQAVNQVGQAVIKKSLKAAALAT